MNYTIRFVFVGDSGSGKTSIISAINQSGCVPQNVPKTLQPIKIPSHIADSETESFTLMIDTSSILVIRLTRRV